MKANKGLSLVELIVVIAVMSVIGAILVRFLILGNAAWHSGDAEIRATQEARKGIMSMVKELRQTNANSLRTIGGALYQDNTIYNSIVFQVVSDNNGDGSVITSTGTTEWSAPITYYVNNGQLIRLFDNTQTVIANNVTALQFCRQVNTLQVMLQTTVTTAEQISISTTLSSNLTMRD